MIHRKNCKREGLKWNGKQFDKQLHAIFIIIIDWRALKDLIARLKDVVHVLEVVWVRLDAEVHESYFELK